MHIAPMTRSTTTLISRRGGRSLLAAALLVGAATTSEAANWYLRPAGEMYGRGDGSSYADAFSGATQVVWTQLRDGDTLFICGTHDGSSGTAADRRLGAARSRITVSGYCRDGDRPDNGRVIGASAKIDHWNAGENAAGIWSHAFVAQGPPNYAMNERGERVLQSAGALTAASPCNSFYGTATQITYKPCAGLGPAGTPTLYLGQVGDGGKGLSTFITATGISDLTVTGLTLELFYNTFRFQGGRNITLDNVTMRTNSFINEFIHLEGLVDGFTLRNSVLCDGGNGVYGYSQNSGNAATDKQSNVVVENNEFCMLRGHTDSHGIGLQNGDNWVIRNNRFHDLEGTAITMYLWAGGPAPRGWSFRNILIEGNVITDIYAFPPIHGHRHSTWQRGIEVTGDINCTRSKDDMRDIVIRNNTLSNITKGGMYIQAPQTTDGSYAVSVIGNRIDNIRDPKAGHGILWANRLPSGCNEVSNFPAASVLIARNTISGVLNAIDVYIGAASAGTRNFNDLSQVALRDNDYAGSSYILVPTSPTHPERNQQACLAARGTWDTLQGLSCRFTGQTVTGLQSFSQQEQGTVAH